MKRCGELLKEVPMAKTNLFFFSGNDSFNADQFADLDQHKTSRMLMLALRSDGTEV